MALQGGLYLSLDSQGHRFSNYLLHTGMGREGGKREREGGRGGGGKGKGEAGGRQERGEIKKNPKK